MVKEVEAIRGMVNLYSVTTISFSRKLIMHLMFTLHLLEELVLKRTWSKYYYDMKMYLWIFIN